MVELSQTTIILGLSLFIALLSFKPSEPYLSQYLICEKDSQKDYCSGYDDINACSENNPCSWSTSSLTCDITSCSDVSQSDCGNSDYDYCEKNGDSCIDARCYKHFTNDQVNNEIYPWSTYAYLPFLLFLGLYAELFSYRMAILVGILGRVVTRFLLIYGTSMMSMQLMQVVYALGTAAEDVFSAYIYYIIIPENYQLATSYIKAAALASSVLSGVLGDLLVVLGGSSLNVLMWISAVSVCIGFCEGLFFLKPSNKGDKSTFTNNPHLKKTNNYNRSSEWDEGTNSVVSVKPSRNDVISEKLKMMKRQLNVLKMALYSRSLSAMLFLWILGNAVFMTLYDFEVAIYEELNGSNEWNGSVLAAMLVAGTIGALLPVWLHKDVSSVAYRTRTDSNSSASRRTLMNIADVTNNAEEQDIQEPKRTENVHLPIVPEVVVAIRLIVMSVLSCVTLLLFIISWEVVASVCFLALFFFCWQYINVVIFARLALELKVIQLEFNYQPNNREEYPVRGNTRFQSNTNNEVRNTLHKSHVTSLPPELDEFIDTSLEDTEEEKKLGDNSTKQLLSVDKMEGDSGLIGHNVSFDKSSFGKNSGNLQIPTIEKDDLDPPYSISIVSIIALSVVVQIIIQSIMFSWLQLDLRDICWILVCLFIAATGFYMLFVVPWFGSHLVMYEIRKIFKLSR